jgi:hypothetical protein
LLQQRLDEINDALRDVNAERERLNNFSVPQNFRLSSAPADPVSRARWSFLHFKVERARITAALARLAEAEKTDA